MYCESALLNAVHRMKPMGNITKENVSKADKPNSPIKTSVFKKKIIKVFLV